MLDNFSQAYFLIQVLFHRGNAQIHQRPTKHEPSAAVHQPAVGSIQELCQVNCVELRRKGWTSASMQHGIRLAPFC